MWLDCGQYGQIPLDRIGRGLAVAKGAQSVPACMATLFVSVDGDVQQHLVRLTSAFRGRVVKFCFDDGVAPF